MDRVERAELVIELLKGLGTHITEEEMNEMADIYLLENKSIERLEDDVFCSQELDEDWARESI